MRHRIALVVGSVAATAALTIALAAGGFGLPAPAATAVPAAVVNTASDAPPSPQVDTIYVAPPTAPKTITVHRTVVSSGEHEGGDSGEGGSND